VQMPTLNRVAEPTKSAKLALPLCEPLNQRLRAWPQNGSAPLPHREAPTRSAEPGRNNRSRRQPSASPPRSVQIEDLRPRTPVRQKETAAGAREELGTTAKRVRVSIVNRPSGTAERCQRIIHPPMLQSSGKFANASLLPASAPPRQLRRVDSLSDHRRLVYRLPPTIAWQRLGEWTKLRMGEEVALPRRTEGAGSKLGPPWGSSEYEISAKIGKWSPARRRRGEASSDPSSNAGGRSAIFGGT